jgi:hypothetical protein
MPSHTGASAPSANNSASANLKRPRFAFLLTSAGKLLAAAIAAIGGALGLLVWNYARSHVAPTLAYTMNVETHPSAWDVPIGNTGSITYVVPREPEKIGKPPSKWSWDWQNWVRQMGGIDARTHIRVFLQGRTENQIVVQEVRAAVIRRGAPLTGTAITSPSGGASPEARYVTLNLDTGRPVPGSCYDPYSESLSKKSCVFALNQHESGVIYIDAATKKSTVEWRLKIGLIVNGKPKFETVPKLGKPPFRTTADRTQPHFQWDDGWKRMTQ